MTPVYAWTMKDGSFNSTGLWVHLLLVDRYFTIGTQWPDGEDTHWYTKRYVDAEEARDTAVFHTGMLEKTGDTMEKGPVAAMVYVELNGLDKLVEHDVASWVLDAIYDEVMIDGRAA